VGTGLLHAVRKESGWREKKRASLYGKLGLPLAQTRLKIRPITTGGRKKYEGLEPSVKTTYDEMFREDGAVAWQS